MLERGQNTKPFTMRIPVDLRAALDAKAQQTRRSVTSLVLEGIEKVTSDLDTPPKEKKLSFVERARLISGKGRVGEGLDQKGMAERMRLIRGED